MPGSKTGTRPIKLPKVSEYVKNVGKSVGYAAIEGVKMNTPGMKDFMETNNDIFKEVYGGVKNYRQTIRETEKSIRQSNIYRAIDTGVRNLVNDAKTGKFYNDRSSDYAEEMIGVDGDYDIDFSVEGSSSDKVTSSSFNPGAKMISDSVSDAIGAAAISQNSAVAEGTSLVVRANSANTKLIMTQMDRISARFTSGMGSVFTEVGKINGFLNGPMMAHMENSRKYYEETTKLMRDNSMMLKELLEMQRNLYKAQSDPRKSSNYDNSFLSSGMPDFAGYMKNVKSNARNFMDSRGMGMLSSGMGNPFMMFAAAPFQMLMENMANRILPKDFKKNLRSLDQGISGLFPQLIAKLNKARDEDGGILGLIGEIFGIQLDKKDKINVSNYKKTAVPFDGITRQAIIETIPGYLSRIEAALTGSGERHYDFQAGSWKSAKQIEKEFADEKNRAIMQGNFDAKQDLNSLISDTEAKSAAAAAGLKRGINNMFEKIFEDGGDFNPNMPAAWMYYGFANEDQFKAVMSQISKKNIRKFAKENMGARENLSAALRRNEQNGGTYRHIFNGAYDNSGAGTGSKNNPSDFTTGKNGGMMGILVNSKDSEGKNVFNYLNKITENTGNIATGSAFTSRDKEGNSVFFYLKRIYQALTSKKVRARDAKNAKKFRNNQTQMASTSNQSNSVSSSNSSSDSGDDGDPGGDDDLDWASYENEKAKEDEKSKKSTVFTDKLKNILGDTKIAKAIGGMLDGASNIIKKPMDYMTKMLKKADENLFQMMFGEKTRYDSEGKPYDSVFDYIIDQVKEKFKEVSEYVKKLFDPLKDKLKEWFKPMWDKYGAPVLDELKGMGRRAKDRVKQGVDNTFGKAFRAAQDAVSRPVIDSNDIKNNAMGGLVTKRGLTMISPGEMIIPASFDKREQRRMLMEEKKEKNRIMNAISFHAEGTVDTEKMKANLQKIYDENKGKGAKNAAGGIAGAGVGLLTGVNPLLGAMAGAGLSILSNSESFQKVIFGDEATGKKGLVPQKVQDFFKKAAPDMGDFGIAGGILGLLTPFGPLGGAAIGAGVGMLKNSESFQKFIFGDESTGKEGLMSRKTFDKFKNMVSKAVPNMAVGAVGGALLGPFGILGNAVMGAGLGLLSSTDAFHNFVFGDKENPEKGSLVGAINRGIIDPAKEKIAEILTNLKDYAKKNIFEPLKNFWEPFKQGIKNTVTGLAESIKDHVNDMFEKSIGIPLHDFLQEKIFKPLTKTFFNILKLPINLAKGAIALPFKALGGIGKNVRMKQIHKGKAYDMSAAERNQYRKDHSFRNGFLGRDRMKEQDEMLANMTPEQLIALREGAANGLMSQRELQKDLINKRRATGQAMSSFFNTKDENGKLRYDTAKYKNVKKITRLAEEGNIDEAMSMIDKLGLSDKDKAELKKKIEPKATAASEALERMNRSKDVGSELDKEASKLLKRKFKGRSDRRQMFKSAEAELKARAKNKASTEQESDETRATNNFAELYKGKADKIIELFNTANTKLDHIINPDAASKDTTPAGDKAAQIAKDTNQEVDITKGTTNATTSAYTKVIKKAEKNAAEAAAKTANPITGKPMNEDSKEYKEAEKKEEEKNAVNERIAKAVEETNTEQKGFFNSLLGFGKGKKKKEGGGILDKLGNGIGGFLRFLGVGAGGIASMGLKVIGIGAGVSLLGYASEWFKTSIWPTIKGALFGKENEDGSKTNGLLGGFGNTLHDLFYGKDGEPGVLAKAGNWIGTKLSEIKDWYTGKGGLIGIISNDILPKMITGWGYAIDNIVTPLTAMIFKHLPGLLLGLGKGILNGLKLAVFNKELKRSDGKGTMEINSSSALKELNSMHSSNSAALESAGGEFMNSVKNAYRTAQNGAYTTAETAASYDFSGIFESATDSKVNNEKASGVSGLLGAKDRTNKIEYDDEGNITTAYTRNNKSDSVMSRVGTGTKNAFLRGVAGDAGGSLVIRGMRNIGTKGTALGVKGSTKLASKTATGLFKKGVKASGSIMGGAANAGEAINKGIEAAGNRPGEIATKVAKYGEKLQAKGMYSAEKVTELQGKMTEKLASKGLAEGGEEVAKKGIGKGLAKIFNAISKSKIGAKLCAFASKATGKQVTQEIMDKTLGKIAEKLSQKATTKLAGKAIGKVASAIAGFSPLAIAFMVKDFISGFSNAYTILGVAKGGDYEVNIGQKCACGLLNVLNQRFLLGLIPTDTIMDIIIEYLFPLFGLDAENLNKAREEAAGELDKWNKEHPDDTYDNLEDFNNKDKWTYKAKKWAGQKLGAAGDWIKEKAGGAWNKTKEGVSNAASAVVNQIKEFPKNTKDGIVDAKKTILSVMKGDFSVFNKKYWNFSESADDDGNPLSMMSKIESSVFKFLSMPHAMIGYVGSKLWAGFKALISGAKEGVLDASTDIAAVAKGQYTIFNSNYWHSDQTADDGSNPMSTLGKIFGFVSRLISAPHAMMGWTVSKIISGFKTLVSGAKEGTIDAAEDVLNVMKGQYSIFSADYWKTNDQEENNNPISKIGKVIGFVERLFMAPRALMGWTVSKVASGFKTLIAGAKEGSIDATEDVDNVSKGKYTIFNSNYWHSDKEDNDGNELSGIGKVFGFITRIVKAPGAMIGYVFTKAKEGFIKLINGAKEVDEETDKIIDKAKDGDISVFSKDYWKALDKDDNPLGLIGTISSFIQRLVEAPIVIFTRVFNKIKEKFDSIKGWFSKLFGEDAESVDTGGSGKKGKGKFGFGRISQLDPSIASIPYNGHTMAQAGCGPVAATNLINNIKGNNGITVQQAAKYATSKGFKPKNDGTDPEYMSSILSASGIDNKKLSGSGQISDSLKQGNPVVIMGKGDNPDSPYGNKSPHYITAMGYDKRGNVVVDDPYEPGYRTYNKNAVLKGARKSVSAKAYGKFGFGRRRQPSKILKHMRFGFGKFGSDTPVGSYVEIPANLGTHETYMGYHLVTNKTALATQLKEAAKASGRYKAQAYDDMVNCATIDGRLCIATVANIGGKLPTQIGDYLDVYFDDGTAWKCIRGDTKCQTVTSYDKNPANAWGHQNGKVIVEVIYDNYSGKCINHAKKVTKIVKVGDYDSGKAVDSNGTVTNSDSSQNSGTSNTLMGALSNLGTSMVKSLFGENAYNAIYGNNNTNSADGSSSSTVGGANGTVEKFVQVALNEEGYKEKASRKNLDDKTANAGKSNYTKYGEHFGNTGPNWPWCAQFVSWSADQAGIPTEALQRSASCAAFENYFKSKNRFHYKNNYTPKRGDVVLFTSAGSSHTGIVTGMKDGKVKTIEGNTSDMVAQRSYSPTDAKITGYGDLGLGTATGTTGLDGTNSTTKAYGKGGFGKGFTFNSTPRPTANTGTGTAKTALMRRSGISYSGNNYSVPSAISTVNSNAVDYNTFLQTIVSVLMNINDNTALLSKVIEILSDNFDIKIDKADIEAAHTQTRAQTEKSLNELVRRSSGNTVGVSKLLNNKDTEYIIEAMKALASE